MSNFIHLVWHDSLTGYDVGRVAFHIYDYFSLISKALASIKKNQWKSHQSIVMMSCWFSINDWEIYFNHLSSKYVSFPSWVYGKCLFCPKHTLCHDALTLCISFDKFRSTKRLALKIPTVANIAQQAQISQAFATVFYSMFTTCYIFYGVGDKNHRVLELFWYIHDLCSSIFPSQI